MSRNASFIAIEIQMKVSSQSKQFLKFGSSLLHSLQLSERKSVSFTFLIITCQFNKIFVANTSSEKKQKWNFFLDEYYNLKDCQSSTWSKNGISCTDGVSPLGTSVPSRGYSWRRTEASCIVSKVDHTRAGFRINNYHGIDEWTVNKRILRMQ